MWILLSASLASDGVAVVATGSGGAIGWARERASYAEAERVALARCKQRDCKVEVWWTGAGCGTVVEGQRGFVAWGYSSTERHAERLAHEECRSEDSGCRTLTTVCNPTVASGSRWRSRPSSPGGPPPSGEPFPTVVTPELIAACEAAFEGDANEQRCVKIASSYTFVPTGNIQACERAFDGDEAELQCLEHLAPSRYDLSGSVPACESAFDGDANELVCVRTIAHAAVDPGPLIGACERAFDGDESELACLVALVPAPQDLSGAVGACESAFDGDANELECLKTIVHATVDPVPLIQACERSANGDDAELGCLRASLGLR